MLWWNEILEGFEECCECICAWEKCELQTEGRLYCPKLTATIFPAPHALPESYHSSKISSMYPPLEHGQDFVTNLPIKDNEGNALGLLRLDYKGGHSFCPTSPHHSWNQPSCQTVKRPRHIRCPRRCSGQHSQPRYQLLPLSTNCQTGEEGAYETTLSPATVWLQPHEGQSPGEPRQSPELRQ